MKFELVASKFFKEQFDKPPERYQSQLKKKAELIEQNPYRFKSIHSTFYSRVFRLRLNIGGKETRLIYVVLGSKVILVCLLDRSKEYRDLENYLAKIEYQ